ncbi:MAG: NAD(P)-binding protein, partial [Pseudomonadota bacterium]|nr:NAD(P)-binding protein [Pseudomonadota bacterium]
MTVLIVGGELAGLVCTRQLHKQNIDVTVLEAADDIGGRVRSDQVDGFILDCRIQVLFDQYPAVRRKLDIGALDLPAWEPGAIICRNGRRTLLTDPPARANSIAYCCGTNQRCCHVISCPRPQSPGGSQKNRAGRADTAGIGGRAAC